MKSASQAKTSQTALPFSQQRRKPASVTVNATTVAGKSLSIVTGCRNIRQMFGAMYKIAPAKKRRCAQRTGRGNSILSPTKPIPAENLPHLGLAVVLTSKSNRPNQIIKPEKMAVDPIQG